MGTMFRAWCSCGYDSADLFEGCGFQQICWDLASCAHCRRLVSVRSDRSRRCPACHKAVSMLEIQYDDGDESEADLEPMPKRDGYRCPACSRNSLRLELTGLWD
jgi:DNA-directed RNA polymerase subunit RPC12/RpoP